jgi:hypothetical protein
MNSQAILSNRHCRPLGKARSLKREQEHKKRAGTIMGAVFGMSLIAALAVVLPGQAGRSQAQFTVSVVVPARVTLAALDQPSELEVSVADVDLGYVDVTARYRVSHNDRRGYLLSLSPRLGLTREIQVEGLAAAAVIREDAVDFVQGGPPGTHDFVLAFRLVLDPAVPPGRYPLPVLVTAQPL